MLLDPLTLRVVGAFTLAIAAGLILSAWVYQRQASALVVWAAAFALAAIAAVLILSQNYVSIAWSVIAANAILASAYGLLWSGARIFNGRTVLPVLALAGTFVWLASYVLMPEIHTNRAYRNTIMAAIGIVYTLATAVEIWRDRGERLRYRLPVIALLTIHALALPLRIPLANPDQFNELITLVMLEVILLSMCCAYLLPGMASERLASKYKHDASIDPLTGVRNRRAFIEQGERIVLRFAKDRQPVALLLFDLDHFKSVNDNYGHAAGDCVLVSFCRMVETQLRPTDLFARLGGEEFVSLLPGSTRMDAWSVAERLRKNFSETMHQFNGAIFQCTISIGVSTTAAQKKDLFALLTDADHALYRAKSTGRNRSVEFSIQPQRFTAHSKI